MNVLARTAVKTARTLCRCSRQGSSYQGDGKMTVTVLNREADMGLMIDSYSQVGFRLNNGMMVLGPMALFPRSVLSWSISGPEDITADSLELFFRLEPRIDLLVLGLGDSGSRPNTALLVECRRRGLNIEALATEQACATFNFLNAESRSVAAAMLPPEKLRATEDDLARARFRHNKLIDKDYE